MIKAIIFDYGGVIGNDPSDCIFKAVSKKFKIDLKKIKKEFGRFVFELEKNQIAEEKFWKKLAQNLCIVDNKKLKKIWLSEFRKYAKINRSILPLIKSLRKHYKLCLLSNRAIFYHKSSIAKLLKGTFYIMISSCNVKMRKPERQIYFYAAKKLKVKPEECLMIDDNEFYTMRSKNMGIEAIHFRSVRKLKKELSIKLKRKL